MHRTTFQITEEVGKQFLVAFVLSDMLNFMPKCCCVWTLGATVGTPQTPLTVKPSRRYRIGLGFATAAPHDDDVAVWQMLSHDSAFYFHAQLKLGVCERHIITQWAIFWSCGPAPRPQTTWVNSDELLVSCWLMTRHNVVEKRKPEWTHCCGSTEGVARSLVANTPTPKNGCSVRSLHLQSRASCLTFDILRLKLWLSVTELVGLGYV